MIRFPVPLSDPLTQRDHVFFYNLDFYLICDSQNAPLPSMKKDQLDKHRCCMPNSANFTGKDKNSDYIHCLIQVAAALLLLFPSPQILRYLSLAPQASPERSSVPQRSIARKSSKVQKEHQTLTKSNMLLFFQHPKK